MRKDKVMSEILGDEYGLTPSDLYSTDFKTAIMGGYDKDEVDAFLERVGEFLENLLKKIEALKKQSEEQHQELEGLREMESTLRNALTSSQKFGENILESARREANALLEEARLSKMHAESRAIDLPAQLRREIEELRAQRDRLRMDIGTVLETHRALLQGIPRAEELALEQVRRAIAEAPDADTEAEETPERDHAGFSGKPWMEEPDTDQTDEEEGS